jgi:hypothetical protein
MIQPLSNNLFKLLVYHSIKDTPRGLNEKSLHYSWLLRFAK